MRAVALAGTGTLHAYADAPHRTQVGLVVLLAGMLVASAWVAHSHRDPLGPALTFVPFALGWLTLDERVDDRVLVAVGHSPGITEADLVVFVIAVLTAVAWRLRDPGGPPALGPRHRL